MRHPNSRVSAIRRTSLQVRPMNPMEHKAFELALSSFLRAFVEATLPQASDGCVAKDSGPSIPIDDLNATG